MKVLFIMFVCILVFTVFMILRNEIAFTQRAKILRAIFAYNIDLIGKGVEPSNELYDMLEPYDKTMMRLWDFGCTHILPHDKYMLIRDYIDMHK